MGRKTPGDTRKQRRKQQETASPQKKKNTTLICIIWKRLKISRQGKMGSPRFDGEKLEEVELDANLWGVKFCVFGGEGIFGIFT
jgi:hypothetical protein